ncbi:hypothetical protein FRC11_014163 [Ceratobasidium sp. 423]|nr:hypothetical protein FRC11_014163 [Ceratobasidium sp. 423]
MVENPPQEVKGVWAAVVEKHNESGEYHRSEEAFKKHMTGNVKAYLDTWMGTGVINDSIDMKIQLLELNDEFATAEMVILGAPVGQQMINEDKNGASPYDHELGAPDEVDGEAEDNDEDKDDSKDEEEGGSSSDSDSGDEHPNGGQQTGNATKIHSHMNASSSEPQEAPSPPVPCQQPPTEAPTKMKSCLTIHNAPMVSATCLSSPSQSPSKSVCKPTKLACQPFPVHQSH